MSIEDQMRVNPDALRFRFDGSQIPWNSTQEQPRAPPSSARSGRSGPSGWAWR